MIWILLFLSVMAFAWFLFAPRRLQTLENIPSVVDEDLKAHNLIETVEDEAEVRPMAEEAVRRAGDKQ